MQTATLTATPVNACEKLLSGTSLPTSMGASDLICIIHEAEKSDKFDKNNYTLTWFPPHVQLTLDKEVQGLYSPSGNTS